MVQWEVSCLVCTNMPFLAAYIFPAAGYNNLFGQFYGFYGSGLFVLCTACFFWLALSLFFMISCGGLVWLDPRGVICEGYGMG